LEFGVWRAFAIYRSPFGPIRVFAPRTRKTANGER
jgi:hypothetical protein